MGSSTRFSHMLLTIKDLHFPYPAASIKMGFIRLDNKIEEFASDFYLDVTWLGAFKVEGPST